MVFSPALALPRATMPPTPASMASASAAAPNSVAPACDMPMRMKKVPYRGPEAPPTEETSVMPVFFSRASAVASAAAPSAPLAASMAATTAAMPRRMFAPWSASPMAASSSVSSSACSAMRAAVTRSQSFRSPTVRAISGAALMRPSSDRA